jgi:hypothetical protein
MVKKGKIKKLNLEKKKKNNRKTLLLIFSVIVLGFSIIALVLPYLFILEFKTFEASIDVSNSIGVNVNNNSLAFGAIFPGGSSSRTLNVVNTYGKPIYIDVVPRGEIKQFVQAQRFVFDTNEQRDIMISATVPKNTPLGHYDGSILFLIKRA